jgi:hypothetical protein
MFTSIHLGKLDCVAAIFELLKPWSLKRKDIKLGELEQIFLLVTLLTM